MSVSRQQHMQKKKNSKKKKNKKQITVDTGSQTIRAGVAGDTPKWIHWAKKLKSGKNIAHNFDSKKYVSHVKMQDLNC